MSVDENQDPPPAAAPHHLFTAEEARRRAQQAKAKAEFILSRAWGLLRDPIGEWGQIEAEDTKLWSILIGYVAPLAALPPLCDLIGSLLFNHLAFVDFGVAIARGVIYFGVSVLLVYLLGLLIDLVAENFEGARNPLSAHKVAAYSMTPSFLSGVFSLYPPLWWVSILALGYTAFLFYRGLPLLMKAPEERAVGYASMVIIAGLVAFIVLFGLASWAFHV